MSAQADVKAELNAAIDHILASKSAKKLVVAGPGAGKTYLFEQLLKAAAGNADERVVLTFINTLKGDLESTLGHAAKVFTPHGYCQYLLHRDAKLRSGLTENFRCYPGLRKLIPKDWQYLKGSGPPTFIKLMRDLDCDEEQRAFYFERCNYYDAVDFDDSVYRTVCGMTDDASLVPSYKLVLVDEFQDFNRMEATIIDLLGAQNAIVIAGDDDQALYSILRGASWDHIRAHYEGGQYEVFELPFCLRCPEVVVEAVNDIIKKALEIGKLNGRIQKPYRYYEPIKGADSAKFPHIDLVEASVQRANAPYFGRYIEQYIRAIPEDDIAAASERKEPVALIIGSNPYRDQVEQYLTKVGLIAARVDDESSERQKALQILSADPKSNLGWRIILSVGNQGTARERIKQAFQEGLPLADVISDEQRAEVLAEAKAWAAEHAPQDLGGESEEPTQTVAVTSYEGSKGRSAQHVFLIGAHSGELPGNSEDIKDIEICRFLVGFTRTKQKCSVLYAKNAMGDFKKPSEFLSWIDQTRFNTISVTAEYWKK